MTLHILMALLFSFWLMSDPYQRFARQIAAGEMPNNFGEVRWACMSSSHCDAAASLKWTKKFEQAMAAAAYEEATHIAEKAVAGGVVDVAAHEMCVRVYAETGDTARADFHRRVQAALLSSYNGDGRSKETAFQVFSIGEEYSLIHFLGLARPVSQALVRNQCHRYDVLTCTNERTHRNEEIFFQIDRMPY